MLQRVTSVFYGLALYMQCWASNAGLQCIPDCTLRIVHRSAAVWIFQHKWQTLCLMAGMAQSMPSTMLNTNSHHDLTVSHSF